MALEVNHVVYLWGRVAYKDAPYSTKMEYGKAYTEAIRSMLENAPKLAAQVIRILMGARWKRRGIYEKELRAQLEQVREESLFDM